MLDGKVVPRDPFQPDASAISADIPMIIGTPLEDFGFTISGTSNDETSIKVRIGNILPEGLTLGC